MWLGAPQREDSYFGRAGFGTPIVNQYGMPDITVYANPRQWWGGANDGSSGNMGSAGGIQTGSHASVLNNPNTGGTVGASDGGFTASIAGRAAAVQLPAAGQQSDPEPNQSEHLRPQPDEQSPGDLGLTIRPVHTSPRAIKRERICGIMLT
jgi:hypothetical protein